MKFRQKYLRKLSWQSGCSRFCLAPSEFSRPPPDLLILAAVSCLWCYKNMFLYFYLFQQKCITLVFDTKLRCTISSSEPISEKQGSSCWRAFRFPAQDRKILVAVSRCPRWMNLTPRATDSGWVSTVCIIPAGITRAWHSVRTSLWHPPA